MSNEKLEILRCRILLLLYSFQFQGGIFALMGTVDPESFDTLHSYANAFEMPFVTPWFPESMYSSSPKVCDYMPYNKTSCTVKCIIFVNMMVSEPFIFSL